MTLKDDTASWAQVDRKLEFYGTAGLSFPQHQDPNSLQINTVFEVRCVIDVNVRSQVR